MNRASIRKRQSLAINQFSAGTEVIEIQVWVGGRVGDAKVEHLAGDRIELRMSSERTDVVHGATEVIFAARLQRHWIQFPRQTLLTESQQRILIWINADIDR